jgi:hypothetical protein
MKRKLRRGETRPAGYTFWIPTAGWLSADKKAARPYFLVERVEDPSQSDVMGTLALMSTKDTEGRQYGAYLHEIKARRPKLRYPDQRASFVNTSWVLFRASSQLREYDVPVQSASVPAVKASLRDALGIGPPSTPAVGSIRGRLVRLAESVASRFNFAYGVVLTADSYSAARRWQTIVPVVDTSAYLDPTSPAEFQPLESDIMPAADLAWCRHLPGGWTPVIDTALLSTFSEAWTRSKEPAHWLKGQIDEVYPTPVDASTLLQIEAALCRRLGLAPR